MSTYLRPLEEVCIKRMWPPVHMKAEPGQLEPPPHPHLWNVMPTVSTVGAIFKEVHLKEQYVTETIWTAYTTELC